MRIRYRDWVSDDYECTVSIVRGIETNEAGQPYATTHTWAITGRTAAADTAAVVAKYRLMEQAFAFWGGDLQLEDSTGTVIERLPSIGSLQGVKITQPPSCPDGTGAQLSTYRDYTLTATASYPGAVLPGGALAGVGPLRAFTETLSFSGGGPRRGVVECINTPPQEQTLALYSAYRATQSGTAVGLLGYPPIPLPIWPAALESAPETSRGSPRFANGVYTEFPVSWSYRYVSALPLVGFPNRWPAG